MKSKPLSPAVGLLFCLLAVLFLPGTARAQYHNFNVTSGSDCIMNDYRTVNLPPTYDAIHNDNVTSSDGGSGYYYGGYVNHQSGNYTLVQYVCWPASGSFPNSYNQQIPYFAGTNMSGYPQIGEGSSCAIKGTWPLFQTNLWVREVMRFWQPSDGTAHVGYQGMWLKEPVSSNWYHLGTFRYPFAVTGTTGMNGWQEDYTGYTGDFSAAYANGYYHVNGAWKSASGIYFTGGGHPTNVKLISNGAAAESDCGPDYTGNVPLTLTVTQPSQPVFDPIIVTNYTASLLSTQLLVQWQLPLSSSPQLGCQINVYNNAGYTGTPALTYTNLDPELRQQLLTLTNVATPYVKLTISDIFFNNTNVFLGAPATVTPVAATNASGTVAGLNYQYYQSTSGDWSSLPNFASLTPVRVGAVDFPDVTPRLQRGDYGFNYTGFLNVPVSGLYAFTLHSGDGSRLVIDGTNVINFDGQHDASQFMSGAMALAAGKHVFNLQYFSGAAGGDYTDGFGLAWEGPGISKMDVPASAFSRVPAANEPAIALVSPVNGMTVFNSNPGLSANVTSNGVTVNGVQFYLTDYSAYYFRPSQGVDYCIGSDTSAPFTFNSMTWLAPTNLVRARLIYNGTNTIDSAPVSMVTTNTSFGAWNWTPLEMHNYPSGGNIQGNTFTVMGDGMNMLSRQVAGDCTFIAHLAGITPNVAGPDGVSPDTSWRAGIVFRSNTNTTIGTPLGNGSSTRFVALFGSVGNGNYFEDDTMRNGNGDANRWSGNLGGANDWYKLQRVGDTFISFVSADGVNWTQVNSTNLPGFGTTIYAGVFDNAVQSANPNVHWASFDSYNLLGSGVLGPVSASISPLTNTVVSGQPATFAASVVGPVPTSYQWQFEGANISNATNSVLTITNVTPANLGNYTIVVDNITSTPAPLVLSAPAGSGVWTNLAGGSWAVSNNWSSGLIAGGTDALADFSTLNLSANETVTLDGATTVGTLLFDDLNSTTKHNWSISTGSGGPLTLAVSSGTPYIVVQSATNSLSVPVAGTQGFNKSGAGYLTLGGSPTFSGTVNVNSGTLEVQSKSGDVAYTISPGATLKVGYSTGGGYANTALSISGLGAASPTGFYLLGGKNYDANGQIQLLTAPTTIHQYGSGMASIGNFDNSRIGLWCTAAASGSAADANIQMVSDGYGMTVQVDPGTNTANGDLTLYGPLNVTASSFYKRGTGSLALNGTAASGNIGVSIQAGTVICGAVNCLGASASVSISSGAALVLNGINQSVGSISEPSGGALNFAGAGTLTANNSPTLAGSLQMAVNKGASPSSSQFIVPSGTLTEGGSLVVNNLSTNSFAPGDTFTLFNAATLAGSFSSVILPVLPVGLVWNTNNLTTSGSISITTNTWCVWTGGGANANWSTAANWNSVAPTNQQLLQFQGTTRQTNTNDVLSAVGQAVFNNGGFTLTGNPVSLQWGLVNQTGNNTWAIGSSLVSPQSFVSTNGTLTVGGAVTNGGFDLTLDGPGTIALSGALSGAGNLFKNGSGTTTLAGTNSYTGNTTINTGKVVLGNSAAIPGGSGNGSVTLNGTLDVAGTSPTLNNLSGAGTVDNVSAGGTPVLGIYASTPTVFSGLIQDTTGTLSILKTGTSTLTLNGTNNYAGSTTISAGTLTLAAGNNTLPTNTVVNFTGSGTLNLGSFNQTISSVDLNDGVTATFISTNGLLTVNGTADFRIGGGTSGSSQTVNMSGLDNFIFNEPAKTFDTGGQTANNVGASSGTTTLATTNLITAVTLGIADAGGYPADANSGSIYLGVSNIINANTFTIGGGGGWAANGTLRFQVGAVNPALTIRSTNGTGRATMTIGLAAGSDYSSATGLVDLTNTINGASTLDALLGTLTVGKHTYANINYNRAAVGTFNMGMGILDATALVIAQKTYSGGRTGSSVAGTFSLNGGTVKTITLTIGDQNSANGPSVTGTFNLNSGALMAGTIQTGAGTATRTFNWNDGIISNYDASTDLSIGTGLTLTLGATGNPTFTLGAGRTATVNAILAGSGSLTKAGAGTVTLLASNTFTGNLTIAAGKLTLGSAGSFTSTPLISVGSGALLDASAVSSFNIGAAQALQGYGSVRGNTIVNGMLAPGGSIGTLTFSNNLVLAGTTLMEIIRTNGAITNDQAVVLGTLTYGGTLTVTNIGTDAFQSGDSFKLFSTGTPAGAFSSVTLPPLASPLYWTNHLAVDGSIAVVSAISTTPTTLATQLSGTNLTLSWPSDHTGWRLVMQIDSLGTGLGNNWTTVANSAGTNQMTMPVNATYGSVFYRLVYP